MKFIHAMRTQHTGGNCMADLLFLANGKAICISDDGLCVFDNPNDFINADGLGIIESGRELEDAGTFARHATGVHALTFCTSWEMWEPDGPVSVDLVTLVDGRVLGIDTETLVIYPDRATFEGFTEGTVESIGHLPMIGLDETDDHYIERLTAEFCAWCDRESLPKESADELIARGGLTAAQRAYLDRFIERWDDVSRSVVDTCASCDPKADALEFGESCRSCGARR